MTDNRALVNLALLLAAGWLLYLLAPILMPFLAGALLAYVCNPAVGRLAGWRVPRTLAAGVVFVGMMAGVVALVAFIVPLIEQQVSGFLTRLPRYLEIAEHEWLPRVQELLGGFVALDVPAIKEMIIGHWQEIGQWLRKVLSEFARSGLGLLGVMLNLALIPIVFFYLLLDWDRLPGRVLGLCPPRNRAVFSRLARETDAVLGSFLRGQLLVMLSLATVYSAGLMLVGLDLALPIGVSAGLVSFVPYLGFIVGLGGAGVAAWLQFHDPMMMLAVAAVFVSGQLLDGVLLTPRLVGERIGLHPVAVIFAVMAGGQLFGFFGVLLALPTAAVLKVWLRHWHEHYVIAVETPRRPRRRP
jgi:predicted PurR-regulated permease PerM